MNFIETRRFLRPDFPFLLPADGSLELQRGLYSVNRNRCLGYDASLFRKTRLILVANYLIIRQPYDILLYNNDNYRSTILRSRYSSMTRGVLKILSRVHRFTLERDRRKKRRLLSIFWDLMIAERREKKWKEFAILMILLTSYSRSVRSDPNPPRFLIHFPHFIVIARSPRFH